MGYVYFCSQIKDVIPCRLNHIYVADFMNGILTREQFWIMAKFKYPTHQINFCTDKALQCITFKGYEEIKK